MKPAGALPPAPELNAGRPEFHIASNKWAHVFLSEASEAQATLDYRRAVGSPNLPDISVTALRTFFEAKIAYEKEDYQRARSAFTALWRKYPRADPKWAESNRISDPCNIGHPPAYNAILMLQDCVNWQIESAAASRELNPQTIVLSVLLVGETSGRVPRTIDELKTPRESKYRRRSIHGWRRMTIA